MVPNWLHVLAIAYLVLGGVCALVVAVDETRWRQHMWIMYVVWPVTALFGTVGVLWLYFENGRGMKRRGAGDKQETNAGMGGEHTEHEGHGGHGTGTPFPIMVAKGSLHCGSGCTLGDICAEWLAFGFPVIATWFGWQAIFHEKMFAVWVFDFILAWIFGVAFQYFTIAPMRGLSVGKGIVAAMKADTLSLTAWQVGMYGAMAIAKLWVFDEVLRAPLEVNSVEFWFVMQLAMMCGFVTAYPVNWWLIKVGVKEKM